MDHRSGGPEPPETVTDNPDEIRCYRCGSELARLREIAICGYVSLLCVPCHNTVRDLVMHSTENRRYVDAEARMAWLLNRAAGMSPGGSMEEYREAVVEREKALNDCFVLVKKALPHR